MDAAGKDFVLIETVGVGQDEVEIAGLAQVTVVVLVPGMGDDVQAIKAGIMEIADIFVINKADQPGADRVERELQAMLSLADGTHPPIVRTVATEGTGIAELLAAIDGAGDSAGGAAAMAAPSIDHLGIAVRALDPAIAFYESARPRRGASRNRRRTKKCTSPCCPPAIRASNCWSRPRPIRPSRSSSKSAGPACITWRCSVPDLTAAVERLRAAGARLLNEPRQGAGGHLYVFVHPASTGGVLLELIQENWKLKAEIGIIGGSGLYSMPGFEAQEEANIETPFGAPSDNYVLGTLAGRQVAFLARHGRGHRISPSELNFRANIYGMKSLGVERIISLSAVGSLKEEHRPLDFVIPDQFFDRTRGRISTFFGEGLVAHISFADPICPELAEVVAGACHAAGVTAKKGGTYLCMEGPAFSTKAESNVYRSWGMDVIGMTNLQEAKLAREAEICYVTVAMVTDYDCWHPRSRRRHGDRHHRQPGEERRERLQGGGGGGGAPCPRAAPASAARRWRTPSSPTATWCRKPRARSWGS